MNITAGSSFTHRVASPSDTSSQRKVEALTQAGVAHAVDSRAADRTGQLSGQNDISQSVASNRDEENSSSSAEKSESGSPSLSEEDQRIVGELAKRDSEVRAHEAAHLSAAGSLAQGGARLQYTNGPDGRRYATAGEVSIDTSKADTPQATIIKAQRIRAAALAPAQPSAQDLQVSAQASQLAVAARAEAVKEQRADRREEQDTEQNEKVEATSDNQTVASATQNVDARKARTEATESNSEEKELEVQQVEASVQVREYSEIESDVTRPSGSGRLFNLVA